MSPDSTLTIVLFIVVLFLIAVVLVVGIRIRRSDAPTARKTALTPSYKAVTPQQQPPIATPSYLLDINGARLTGPVVLTPKGLTIGRLADNDLVVDEVMVSRRHAEIVQRGNRYVIRDLDSSNGTWVDGNRVSEHPLASGNRIRIGNFELLFTHEPFMRPVAAQPDGSAARRADSLPAEVDTYFDGFRLEHKIGEGGMAKVFKARAPDGSCVALKILNSTDPYLIRKFKTEGNDIGPRLRNHPNIAAVFDLRSASTGELYIVEEFVEGESLRQRLQRGPLNEADTIRVMQQVSNALGYAHRLDIVHRDMKPENVLLTPTNQVKVVDFGIARVTTTFTLSDGKLIGTPEYMSPEQANGDDVRPASDIYSLGIMTHEMLTGMVPFPMKYASGADYWTNAIQVVHQHLYATPPPLRQRVAAVSPQLERITARCLEKEWQKRYSNGYDLATALGARPSNITPGVSGAPSARPQAIVVRVMQGPKAGVVFPIQSGLVIGRNEVSPGNLRLSRSHIRFDVTGGDILLDDLSVNGTFVNQKRVSGRIALKPGDRIGMDDCVLQVLTMPPTPK